MDIDLDAFVEPIAYWRKRGRLSDEDFTSWPEQAVRTFLELRLGLVRNERVPGVFVEHHDSAFDHIASLEPASASVSLVHIDAHADLGMGDSSWVYMHKTYLQSPLGERPIPIRGPSGLNPGSWLAFAVAAGWVSDITFVHPDEGAQDLPPIYFDQGDSRTRRLVFKRYSMVDLTRHSSPDYESLVRRTTPLSLDPAVPFETVTLRQFQTSRPFDRALVCHSPDYTPPAVDSLINVIAEYIQF